MTRRTARPRSPGVGWHASPLTRERRWQARGTCGATVWFTGLPASGTSTIAVALETRFVERGRAA